MSGRNSADPKELFAAFACSKSRVFFRSGNGKIGGCEYIGGNKGCENLSGNKGYEN